MSKSKFIRTLSESKTIFASKQKVIVLSFVKIVAFLLGHPVYACDNQVSIEYVQQQITCST